MNPEEFQDAMNHLDDDLIEETDALRQGERVMYPGAPLRRALQWLVPAACLVLVLGLGARWGTTGSSDALFNQEALGDVVEEGFDGFSQSNGANLTPVTCGTVTVSLPEGWEWEPEAGEDGSMFIRFWPAGCTGVVKVGYQPNFGVCGTGLETRETTIAGMRAHVGTYDGGDVWSFITFPGTDYVIINDGADSWLDANMETVEQILETIEFEN